MNHEEKFTEVLLRTRAIFPEMARDFMTEEELRKMLAKKKLTQQATTFGPVLIPGEKMLSEKGMSKSHQSPGSAMDMAYLAYAIYTLEEHDYHFEGWITRRAARMRSPEGSQDILVAQSRGHSPRSIRRMLKRWQVELARRAGRLLIISPNLRRLDKVADRNHYLVSLFKLNLPEPKGVRHPRNKRNEGHKSSGPRRRKIIISSLEITTTEPTTPAHFGESVSLTSPDADGKKQPR